MSYERTIDMYFRLSLIALLLIVAGPVLGQTPQEEEYSVRAMWARFEEFYNKGDADGVAGLYAEDADRITLRGEVAHGRAEIREQYVAELARREADTAIQPLRAEFTIRFLRSDVALLDAKAVWTVQRKIQFTVIATKESGQWLIAAGRPRGTLQQ